MSDLVGTCPQNFWEEWIAEGDAASTNGTVYPSISGEDWHWFTRHRLVHNIRNGDRFYVVAHGKLRGWAPVIRVDRSPDGTTFGIVRRGGAVACTIPETIPGFRGLRIRWWEREDEVPFPDWKTR